MQADNISLNVIKVDDPFRPVQRLRCSLEIAQRPSLEQEVPPLPSHEQTWTLFPERAPYHLPCGNFPPLLQLLIEQKSGLPDPFSRRHDSHLFLGQRLYRVIGFLFLFFLRGEKDLLKDHLLVFIGRPILLLDGDSDVSQFCL